MQTAAVFTVKGVQCSFLAVGPKVSVLGCRACEGLGLT